MTGGTIMRGQIWPPNHREAASAPGYNTTGLLPPLSRSHTPLAQVERPPSGGAATHPRRSGSAPVSLEALLHGEAGALHARSGAEVERRSSRPLYHTPGGEVRKWKGRRPTETPVRCKPYSGHLILQTPTPTPTPTLIHSVHIYYSMHQARAEWAATSRLAATHGASSHKRKLPRCPRDLAHAERFFQTHPLKTRKNGALSLTQSIFDPKPTPVLLPPRKPR